MGLFHCPKQVSASHVARTHDLSARRSEEGPETMPHTDDHVLTADEVFADLIRDGDALAAAPLFPCPRCGRETKEHHTPKGSRICSNAECRAKLVDPAVIEASREMGQRLQPVVIPCPECGAVTKEHHTPEGSRICVGVAGGERHVLEPGTFDAPERSPEDRGEWVPGPGEEPEARDGGEVTLAEVAGARAEVSRGGR